MRRFSALVFSVLLLGASAATTEAQVPAPPTRQGVWLGAGVGYGAVKLSCPICGDRVGGPSGYLRFGTTVTPSFLLGAEVTAWRGKTDNPDPEAEQLTQTSANVFAVAYWYPDRAHGFYFKGGLGLVAWRAGGDEATTNSFGGLLGLGYEIPVDPQWSVVPFLNYMDSSDGTLRFNGADLPFGASTSMFQFGLGVTYH